MPTSLTFPGAGAVHAVRRSAAAILLAGCTMNMQRIQEPPASFALTTTGPWHSMIYLARTDSGVVTIDLGWLGARQELKDGLQTLGATREDVVAVFLTHSHRDHIAGWEVVREAPFYLGAAEVARFTGQKEHDGPVPDLLSDLVPAHLPAPGELDLHAITGDTAIAFGTDTVRAFPIPGHTAGSVAYLLRGVLFVGDALGHTPFRGFHTAEWLYSDDVARSRVSVDALRARLDVRELRFVCTAHAKCATPDEIFGRGARQMMPMGFY